MTIDFEVLRREYLQKALNEEDMNSDPVKQFDDWFQTAVNFDFDLPNAMALATANLDGMPSVRYVLLKEYDKNGFVFYSNANSSKGKDLSNNPYAALVLYWAPLDRQIRIEGQIEILSDEQADKYFRSRPFDSQISAIASPQSTIVSKEFLEDRVEVLTEQYRDNQPPRPEGWIGYRVIPHSIEFWQGREHRLHDRILYTFQNDVWIINRLAP
jgi:pyridoxamine 5'-phosphate oxidase